MSSEKNLKIKIPMTCEKCRFYHFSEENIHTCSVYQRHWDPVSAEEQSAVEIVFKPSFCDAKQIVVIQ